MADDIKPLQPRKAYWFTRNSQALIFLVLVIAAVGAYLAFTIPVSVFPSTDFPRIVIGVDSAGVVVASLLFDMPPILWSRLLGGGAAEIGAVGVAESRRNLGVGTALVARACQILRDRGVETAVLRWLYRVDFYRRIGFRVWKQYVMSSKTLDYVSAPYGAPPS